MQLEKQFPSSGHLDGCLQLLVFVAALVVLFFIFIFVEFYDDLPHVSCAPLANFCVVFVE